LKKAVELDPEYGRAYAALALAYFRVVDSLWGKELGRDEPYFWWGAHDYVELAKKYPTSLSYTVEALRDVYQGLAEDARRNAGRAIALDPNDPEAHIATAWALTISGEPAEALNFVATAMRLNPNYPSHYVLARGLALFAMGDLKQAAEVFGEGVSEPRRNCALSTSQFRAGAARSPGRSEANATEVPAGCRPERARKPSQRLTLLVQMGL
jgi:tetratricopeptide (TPR) repeat protein